MRAGTLRHRVTIQQNTPTQDAFGEPIESWSTYATVWAAVEPLTGNERFVPVGAQVQATVSTRIRIRYRDGVTNQMRVLWGSRIYRIEAVLNLEERDREIHLLCEEWPDG